MARWDVTGGRWNQTYNLLIARRLTLPLINSSLQSSIMQLSDGSKQLPCSSSLFSLLSPCGTDKELQSGVTKMDLKINRFLFKIVNIACWNDYLKIWSNQFSSKYATAVKYTSIYLFVFSYMVAWSVFGSPVSGLWMHAHKHT